MDRGLYISTGSIAAYRSHEDCKELSECSGDSLYLLLEHALFLFLSCCRLHTVCCTPSIPPTPPHDSHHHKRRCCILVSPIAEGMQPHLLQEETTHFAVLSADPLRKKPRMQTILSTRSLCNQRRMHSGSSGAPAAIRGTLDLYIDPN